MVYLIPRVIYISNQEVVFVLFNLRTRTEAFPELTSKMATLPSTPPRSSYDSPDSSARPPPRSSYDSPDSSARTTKSTLAERLRNYINSLPSLSRTTLTEKKTQLTSSSTQTIGYCHELTPLLQDRSTARKPPTQDYRRTKTIPSSDSETQDKITVTITINQDSNSSSTCSADDDSTSTGYALTESSHYSNSNNSHPCFHCPAHDFCCDEPHAFSTDCPAHQKYCSKPTVSPVFFFNFDTLYYRLPSNPDGAAIHEDDCNSRYRAQD